MMHGQKNIKILKMLRTKITRR